VDAAVRKHLFTVEEFHRMGEAGIFGEDDRVELIGGEVVRMSPIGWRHAYCVSRLNEILFRFASGQDLLGRRYVVNVQNPIALNRYAEPQPDLVLTEGLPVGRLPGPAEVALVVEVSDTTLRYDRETKLPLYAAAGVPEVWIVDLQADAVEVHSEPASAEYRAVSRQGRDGRVASATLAGLAFDVAEVLPPPSA